MPPSRFPCPYCSVPLRIRNRTLIGKQLACPECGKTILIASDGPRGLALKKVQPKPHSKTERPKKAEGKREKPGRLSRWLSVLRSPVGISWSVVALLAIMLLIAAWPFGNPASKDRDRLQEVKQELATKKSVAKKLSHNNGENQAAGRSEQAVVAKRSAGIDGVAESDNEFPSPVAAEKPISPIVVEQEQKPVSNLQRPPVVATIPPDPIDVAAALGQPILRFEQQQPTPLRELLMLVEEMAGVPIRYNASEIGDEAIPLDEPISLQLEETTVGEILRTVLKQVHLDYEIGYNEIRIVSTRQEPTEENP